MLFLIYYHGFMLIFFRVRDNISKIDGYVERVIPGYLPEQFKRHFRVSRETFQCILLNLANFPTLQRRQRTVEGYKQL